MLPNKKPYTVNTDPLYKYMQNVSRKLDSPFSNNTIKVSESNGMGFVKNFFVEKGFCIGYYHICLNEDLYFKWTSKNEEKDGTLFKLIFSLDGNAPMHTENGNSHVKDFAAENSTVLYSTNFERTGFIPKHTWFNTIAMVFTRVWLKENFSEASDKIYEIVNLLIKKEKPTFISELMDQNHYIIVKELAKEMSKEDFAPIHIKAKSLLLVNDFLDRLMNRRISDISSNQTLYQPEMIKVEKRISDYFNKPFPNINSLAKEFNMSGITLKRHFKIVYGKSIYQYYLEKKLAIGKEMIFKNKKTISEIAYTLGYNKINSFSRVFKKYYGVLPSEVDTSCVPDEIVTG